MNSERYQHQFDCEPPRFSNDELVRRYYAGEFLYHREKRDAEKVIAARQKRQLADPVEIVAVAVPVLAEAVSVLLFIALMAVVVIIRSGRV